LATVVRLVAVARPAVLGRSAAGAVSVRAALRAGPRWTATGLDRRGVAAGPVPLPTASRAALVSALFRRRRVVAVASGRVASPAVSYRPGPSALAVSIVESYCPPGGSRIPRSTGRSPRTVPGGVAWRAAPQVGRRVPARVARQAAAPRAFRRR